MLMSGVNGDYTTSVQVCRLIYSLCYYGNKPYMVDFLSHGLEAAVCSAVIGSWDELAAASVGNQTALSYCLMILEVGRGEGDEISCQLASW